MMPLHTHTSVVEIKSWKMTIVDKDVENLESPYIADKNLR